MRKIFVKAAVLCALLVVAVWMISPSVRAAETEMGAPSQGGETQIGPSTDVEQDPIDKSSFGLRENVTAPDLTKDVERPMGVPDPRSEMIMPDRRPLCGPWKNAINHYACAPGYDSY